ncbi:PilZ domain-containing protein [Marinobacterium rhizophilum]|uniref:PilZ domain-containing protein n=1 Tax=Marinobacterium rhizophilum TaxID=420402 RepID=A0ABY5HMK1_9GAMM|nr:PilZ domain-containing protein [Marinobacterium rhizophilum]UTW13635.1 PilZ domain-containing protein [Marinobacterium rhizophilum]
MVQDRRQFYRIEHQVAIEYKRVSEAEVMANARPYQFNVPAHFLLLSELQAMDSDTGHLLRKIGEKQPEVSAYLKLLDDKVNRIARSLVAEELKDTGSLRMHNINLSEGGLSFDCEDDLPLGQHLALKLIFPHSLLGLLLYATVQRNEALEGEHLIGLEFIKMPESCRTLLARFVLEAQAQERQRQLNADA